MSDWYRSGRDDDQRGYGEGGGRRREASGRDRWSERNGYGTERRSFEEGAARNYGVGYEGYRSGEGYRSEGRRDEGQRDFWRAEQGQGWAPRSEGYGGRGYGREDYRRGRAYGADDDYPRDRGYGAGGRFDEGNRAVNRVADGDFGGWRENIAEGRDRDERRMGEHRGRGPKNYTRSDERIREDVNDRLTDDHRLDASEIDVAVKDCEVTLTGTVRSREDKRRAEDIAEDVSGVKHVQCNLRVQQPGTTEAQAQGGRGIAGRTAGTA